MLPFDMRPDAVLQELTSYGQKLSHGMKNLMEVGEISSGVTPKTVVYQEDKLTLYRFENPNKGAVPNKVPLLIVYALVNRPYMTDIQENRSTVRALMEAGQDVYLVDWGYPDRADRYLTLDDYINGYLDRCVDAICERHRIDKINILGICQGGTFSLCYSALHPDKVKNLVTMVTPVDFQTPDNMLSHWVQQVDADLVVDTMGNVPGEMLNWTFLNLKPYQLMGQKYLGLLDTLDDPEALKNFLRMEKWIFDSPDQAGEAFRQFIKDFYQQNKLLKGGLEIGDPVSLKNVTMPVLNVFAEQDHLVPPDASRAMRGKLGTKDYTELSFPGGHIGIYVSGKAQKTVPPAIGKWLDERS
ncbi:MAG TPA: class III poly(R)-hydroxyalkanoic acid synthase subunit PhaC [Thiobacillaceae bacterium]|nr:class III poly(R)-hydroxyalkanoic acid synthase subunit PhaC [Thiobacillaceae bacterium]HNI07121.1 class III poly(R)-hydroxyalkanoic acid synthase subunit PhaC [Thiobacillaceae bacterium]